jgi:gliding motility-associated-like protein
VNHKFFILFCGFTLLNFCSINGQNVSLYHQFNGRYDFTFVGNTMNLGENNVTEGCENLLITSSSESLNLQSNQVIQSAYLYWAGSGTGDFNVKLNNIDITASRTFSNINSFSGLHYFSAFADVTNQVINFGNGAYTLSDLDVTPDLINEPGYCDFRTNFAGWAMVIVYKDNSLPLNQINIYDGLESIPDEVTINLTNLNVIDNTDARIGFIAWEGDAILAVDETLKINGTVLSSLPLNPANNAFNGTNSFTGSSTLYNMDLDVYTIQNNINIGDTTAQIQLNSGQDVVLINVVVTKLNSQLPDATIALGNIVQNCDSKIITVDYVVSNSNCTNPLQAGTPIAFYADGLIVGQTQTTTIIPIDGIENGHISILIPNTIPTNFILKVVVDDDGNNHGIVTELFENNNVFSVSITQWESPKYNTLEPLISCNEEFTKGTFDFSSYENLVKTNSIDIVKFYNSQLDAQNELNQILNTSNFISNTTPKEVFIRIENEHCTTITSFFLTTKNCLPTIYNFVSANNDSINDTFFIEGLRNIFMNFELEIYNRWGRLIWTGNNNSEDWDGFATKGYKLDTTLLPKGTYFYLLNLNDKDYPKPLTGWLYFTK